MATLRGIKNATELTQGPHVAALFDIIDHHCRVAFGGTISATQVRMVAMPDSIAPYNRALARYHRGNGITPNIIVMFMHFTHCGWTVSDKAHYRGEITETGLADVLLHELVHHYQYEVLGYGGGPKVHRHPSWYQGCLDVSNNLWGAGKLTLDQFSARTRRAWFSDVEMHHFPEGFEARIKAKLAEESAPPKPGA